MGAKLQHSRRSRASTRRLPPQQHAIQTFGKAAKLGAGAGRSDSKDVLSSKKRKLDDLQAEIISSVGGNEQEDSGDKPIAKASKVTRQSRSSSLLSSPHSSSSLCVTTWSSPPLTSSSTTSSSTDNDPSTFSPQILCDSKIDTVDISDDLDDRPQFFHNLITLHSSFLTALSLHYAHNGRSTPADLNQLLPCTEKIWKKRKVEKQDLQRLLYILESGPEISATKMGSSTGTSFRIAQYGARKFCLELLGTSTANNGFGPPFDEAELNDKFSRNLERIWRQWLESSDQQQSNIDFLHAIPLAPIHDSTTSFNSLRTGQQRLLDFQRGVVGLKATVDNSQSGKHGNTTAARARSSGGTGTAGRRNGLLQRIQNKQLKQTTLAPPPSKEAILRHSAVNLIEEVVGVLILLRPSYSPASSLLLSAGHRSSSCTELATPSCKKPYRWNTIIQIIQDSLRCPVSKQEAEACLDLLAQPSVAGEWISIVTVNRIKSVVLRSGCDISPYEVGVRAAHLKD
ncbi:hypothetical protein ACJ72_00828 [Emergomyces africanus]|uniref:DNA replication factor Cdt1 C-terminal domain-containing protein n=1 Tax=Emergomyces africanus TaxID=1955775 RepID=A0A1B7P6Z0_9EURO|nr:hypothetical protein ACJ72_00828 [Emergomyces africanus]